MATQETVYVLIGDQNPDTDLAKKVLEEAGVEYRFAYGEAVGEPWPQLISGFTSFAGLEQISHFASRAQRRLNVG